MAGAVAISWRREGGVRSAMARDKRMTVMVEPEFLDEVKEAARKRRMKMSEWVRLGGRERAQAREGEVVMTTASSVDWPGVVHKLSLHHWWANRPARPLRSGVSGAGVRWPSMCRVNTPASGMTLRPELVAPGWN